MIILGTWYEDNDTTVDYVVDTDCVDDVVAGMILYKAERLHELIDMGENEEYEEELHEMALDSDVMETLEKEIAETISIYGIITAMFKAFGYSCKFPQYAKFDREYKRIVEEV